MEKGITTLDTCLRFVWFAHSCCSRSGSVHLHVARCSKKHVQECLMCSTKCTTELKTALARAASRGGQVERNLVHRCAAFASDSHLSRTGLVDVARRDLVARPSRRRGHGDAHNRSQNVAGVLPVLARILLRPAVADGPVEVVVGRLHPAVVIRHSSVIKQRRKVDH